jgi:hypothetical protein
METIQKAPLASLFNQEPCEDGAAFLEGFDNPQAAWDACQRPDWMCWAMTQLGKGEDTRLRDAAREIALSVFALHFKREDESVSVVFRYLETGDETLRSVAESAAWSAASAAWSAAESVESAAWSAAKSAAWSAAWSAESAAWSAASAAESAAESVARSAAKSAAWSAESAAWSAASAAESAAESVARSAASAAESAACDIIRKHIPNPLEH